MRNIDIFSFDISIIYSILRLTDKVIIEYFVMISEKISKDKKKQFFFWTRGQDRSVSDRDNATATCELRLPPTAAPRLASWCSAELPSRTRQAKPKPSVPEGEHPSPRACAVSSCFSHRATPVSFDAAIFLFCFLYF
jgi:hypothetical protein